MPNHIELRFFRRTQSGLIQRFKRACTTTYAVPAYSDASRSLLLAFHSSPRPEPRPLSKALISLPSASGSFQTDRPITPARAMRCRHPSRWKWPTPFWMTSFVTASAAQSGLFSDRELTEDAPGPEQEQQLRKVKVGRRTGSPPTGASCTILRSAVIYGRREKGFPCRSAWAGSAVDCCPSKFQYGRFNSSDRFPSARRNVHCIGSDAANRFQRHRTLPGQFGPITLAITIPRKIACSFKDIGQGAVWQRIGGPLVAARKTARAWLETTLNDPPHLCRIDCRLYRKVPALFAIATLFLRSMILPERAWPNSLTPSRFLHRSDPRPGSGWEC